MVVPASSDINRMMSFLPAPEVIVGAVPPGHIVPVGHPEIAKAPVLLTIKRTLPVFPALGQALTVTAVSDAVRDSVQFSPNARLIASVAPLWVTVCALRSNGPCVGLVQAPTPFRYCAATLESFARSP